jgi:hypothetical protein
MQSQPEVLSFESLELSTVALIWPHFDFWQRATRPQWRDRQRKALQVVITDMAYKNATNMQKLGGGRISGRSRLVLSGDAVFSASQVMTIDYASSCNARACSSSHLAIAAAARNLTKHESGPPRDASSS